MKRILYQRILFKLHFIQHRMR